MDVIVNDGCFAALNGYSSQDGIKIGLAFLRPRARSDRTDKHHRQLVLVEFLDSDCYGNTEAAITSFGPSSVFIADGCLPDREMEKLTSVLSQFDDASTERLSKSKFGGDVASRLQKLTGGPIAHVENMPLALHAAACLINTGDLMSDASNEGAVEIVAGALDTYLRIDGSAIRALNLFPSRRDAEAVPLNVNNPGLDYDGLLPSAAASKPAARNITSLHELLGFHCKTKGGKRALRRWLLQPLTNPTAINRRQDLVAAFASSVSLRRGWQEGVNIPDLESLGFRLQNKKAGLMDLVRLYSFAKQLPSIIAKLNVDDDDGGDHQAARTVLQSEYIAILEKRAEDFSDYITMMEALLEDPSVNDRPRIKRSWNEKLKELAEERDEIEAGIQACWDKFQRDYDYGSEVKCERDKNRGFWFRTPKKNDKAVRSTATVQIHSVQTDGIHFSNASLRSLSERLLEIESEYEDTQKAVVDEAVTVARTYLPVLEGAGTAIAELDVFASMAIVATTSTSPYVRPALTGIQPGQPRRLRIVQGRHPVVEMQEEVSFIANDYSMDACSDSDADASNSATAGAGAASSSLDAAGRFHIITGPNMGGKSTLIRTLGVLCLMAQIGSFIPAESAEVPILDCICARVGAGDRALKGVSTFMAEMLEASSILATATHKSLVIIDELGRGTSTYDGFGLAWAISEHLALTTKCLTMFATHYHELTALEDELPSVVKNRHVTAQVSDGAITMLYTAQDGACPSSFGIHVAELAAFPPSVIDEAKRKATQLESTSGIILAKHRARAAAAAAASSSGQAPVRSPGGASAAAAAAGDGSSPAAAGMQIELDADDVSALRLAKGKRLLSIADDANFLSLSDIEKKRRIAELLA